MDKEAYLRRCMESLPPSAAHFLNKAAGGVVAGEIAVVRRRNKSSAQRLEELAKAALVFYHSEVPIEYALGYLATLSKKV